MGLRTACDEWEGATSNGYGWVSEQRVYAHRWTWEERHGPIPAGLEVMHLCDNKLCVNLDHLAIGTHTANMAMAGLHGLLIGQKFHTHCKRGHELTEENTYHPPKRPTHRHCRACMAIRGGQ